MINDTDTYRRDGIIETASATTSPDNASSGSMAYVVTILALVVTTVLCWAAGSCVSNAIGATSGRSKSGFAYRLEDYPEDFDDIFDEFDDLDELEYYLRER